MGSSTRHYCVLLMPPSQVRRPRIFIRFTHCNYCMHFRGNVLYPQKLRFEVSTYCCKRFETKEWNLGVEIYLNKQNTNEYLVGITKSFIRNQNGSFLTHALYHWPHSLYNITNSENVILKFAQKNLAYHDARYARAKTCCKDYWDQDCQNSSSRISNTEFQTQRDRYELRVVIFIENWLLDQRRRYELRITEHDLCDK